MRINATQTHFGVRDFTEGKPRKDPKPSQNRGHRPQSKAGSSGLTTALPAAAQASKPPAIDQHIGLFGDLDHALRHLTGGQQEHALRYAGSVFLRLTDVAASLLKSGNFAFPQVDALMQCDFLQRVFKQRACGP